jgi:hypothetical protein
VSKYDENEEHAEAVGGDREEIEVNEVSDVVATNVRHVCAGGDASSIDTR